MRNKLKLNPLIDALVLVAHALFVSGAILLFIYSEESGKPIHLEQPMLYKVMLLYATGYVAVFIKWLSVIKSDEPYYGTADDIPGFLTSKLWGSFPYLGTLGKSNSGNQWRVKKAAHVYQDSDVRGKKFGEILELHVNKNAIFILVLSCAFLPSIFLNQAAPSFLKFIYSSSTLFTIYISFFVFVWLSSIAIILLIILLRAKRNSSN